MKRGKPAAYIIMEFMDVIYKMLIYIQPESGVNDYLRSELIVTMNRLMDEMRPHIEVADAIQNSAKEDN